MKLRKILALIITTLMVLGCVGCSNSSKTKNDSAETVVQNYLNALKTADFDTASSYIVVAPEGLSGSEEDVQTKEFIENFLKNLDYSIVSSAEEDTSATVTAKIENVDMSAIMNTYFEEMVTLAFAGLSEAEMESKLSSTLINSIALNKDNLIENEVSVKLDKTDSGWVIDENNSAFADAILGGMLTMADEAAAIAN